MHSVGRLDLACAVLCNHIPPCQSAGAILTHSPSLASGHPARHRLRRAVYSDRHLRQALARQIPSQPRRSHDHQTGTGHQLKLRRRPNLPHPPDLICLAHRPSWSVSTSHLTTTLNAHQTPAVSRDTRSIIRRIIALVFSTGFICVIVVGFEIRLAYHLETVRWSQESSYILAFTCAMSLLYLLCVLRLSASFDPLPDINDSGWTRADRQAKGQ